MKIKKNLANGGCFNGMQGLKSSNVDFEASDVEERKDLCAKNMVLRPNLGKVKRESRPLFLRDSHVGWEFKKQILERSKRTKVCREIWFSKQVYNLEPRSELGTRAIVSNYDGWKHKSVAKSSVFKRFDGSSSGDAKFKNVSKCDSRLSSVGRDKNVSADSQDAEFSCSIDVSFEKVTLCYVH